MTEAVSRSYRSQLRDTQAAQTRLRVLQASAAAFAEHGYAGTTLAAIATAAEVSVETVKAQGAKHELLLAAYEVAFSGRESREQIMNDPRMRETLAATPDERLPALLAAVAAEMNGTAGRLWLAFTGAAQSDAAVRASLDDLLERRRTDFALVIAEFDRRGLIRTDAPRGELADALSFLASPEGHQQLVAESGWPVDRYASWLESAVRLLVLDPSLE